MSWISTGLLSLLLLCVGWQGFLTGTHHHFDNAPAVTAALTGQTVAARTTDPHDRLPQNTPADCPICREIGHAGLALGPPPLSIVAPLSAVYLFLVSRQDMFLLALAPHGWLSRGPPAPLAD
ncbi:hypothetical protein [Sphingomonas sp.]|uniref:hypothetical protein n=1 Tax=Sphingomonas sp. TaxID=28214 RepID=UPI001EC84E17|nr:hypothetical protein [Sphingomonas sp.]MBX3593310.1 hypothetical protein [Sphingomonas sp.]